MSSANVLSDKTLSHHIEVKCFISECDGDYWNASLYDCCVLDVNGYYYAFHSDTASQKQCHKCKGEYSITLDEEYYNGSSLTPICFKV